MSRAREEFAAAVREIQQAIGRAVSTSDAELFVSLYTPDGALMTPDGAIIKGTAALREAFTRFSGLGWVRQEAELVEVLVDGDLGTGEETTTGTFLVDGRESQVHNNCLLSYVRVDGRWLIHRDIWNTVSADDAGGGYGG